MRGMSQDTISSKGHGVPHSVPFDCIGQAHMLKWDSLLSNWYCLLRNCASPITPFLPINTTYARREPSRGDGAQFIRRALLRTTFNQEFARLVL
jgi:hypothetical protein